MGYLAWTDEEGSATLTNGKPRPARRFVGWAPDVDRVGDKRTALGTGLSFEFLYRKDQCARFSIDKIPCTEQETALRFIDYAKAGCAFYCHTEDAQDRVYEVRWRPGTEIAFVLDDPQHLEYRLSLEVMSAASPAERLLCHYRE
jgi:hypothetical protein